MQSATDFASEQYKLSRLRCGNGEYGGIDIYVQTLRIEVSISIDKAVDNRSISMPLWNL